MSKWFIATERVAYVNVCYDWIKVLWDNVQSSILSSDQRHYGHVTADSDKFKPFADYWCCLLQCCDIRIAKKGWFNWFNFVGTESKSFSMGDVTLQFSYTVNDSHSECLRDLWSTRSCCHTRFPASSTNQVICLKIWSFSPLLSHSFTWKLYYLERWSFSLIIIWFFFCF